MATSPQSNESSQSGYFNQAAATWDDNPVRVALARAVGEAVLGAVHPSSDLDVLDYGCGTGLVGLYLLPHVQSVTGADSSTGMLDVLQMKIRSQHFEGMRTLCLDLQRDPLPVDRYHLVVASMAMHHIADTARVLADFYRLLHPGGWLCVADLDTEPGLFHDSAVAAGVQHLGFDRAKFKANVARIGFVDVQDVTAHTIRKPVHTGGERDFPAFLITARKPAEQR